MRILWHGVGPWHKTGYGVQTKLFLPLLRDLGHEVALAFMGLAGRDDDPAKAHPESVATLRTGQWEGFRAVGPGLTEFALPRPMVVRQAFGGHDPDLIIVLKDAWVLKPDAYRGYNTAIWTAFDCDPLGWPDREFFRLSGTIPIAVSRHGQSAMRDAGLNPLYVPSGIDCGHWTPGDRAAARELLGLPQATFIAGINAANIGTVSRKGFAEQFAGFAEFHGKHPDSMLLVHAVPQHREGIDLRAIAENLGIADVVKFGAHQNMTPAQMLTWYRSLDVLMNATYGEGFGLPVVEAMACGIPVIGTRHAAVPEKIPAGMGWLVDGQQWWNPHHLAWWRIPSIHGIGLALAKARAGGRLPPEKVSEWASQWDAQRVTLDWWKPALERLAP